jgi:NADH-quinone oxidoreductase subunit D
MAHLTPTPVLEPGQDRTMILNMGPQHPSTHGVLRVLLEIDGETVVRMMPDIGFLHTGIEKTCEAKFYQQVVPLTDRIDYLCPMTNNLCYVLAVEKLLGLEIPPKAQWLRVLLNELTGLTRIWSGWARTPWTSARLPSSYIASASAKKFCASSRWSAASA